MKVAFDHQIFSMQRYGGVSRYFFELASRLSDHGVSEVRVVAPLYINNYLAAGSARCLTRGRYVKKELNAFLGIPLVHVANQFAAPLAWLGTNPDIVHETYFAPRPFGKGRRRVVTIYDMIHELFADEFPDAVHVTAAKRASVNRADHVICISENTRRDLVRLYDVDPARTSVVHLGYSMTTEIDAKIDSAGHQPSLLYVGHRGGYKNFKTLLQAYGGSPTLREFELIAFGGGPVLAHEQDEIRRLGITDRVRFESGSDRDLALRYRTATAFICTSMYEGFGLPPLEAMSHGCPVVCSNGGSLPEVVGDAAVHFDPTSPDDLRTALERVATTDELRNNLRARGYTRISSFSWDKCATETVEIYRQIE